MFKSKASRTIGIIVAILVCIIVAVVLVEVFMQHPEELSYDEFFVKLKEGKIKSVYLEGNYKMNVLYVGTSSKSISNNPDAYVYVPNRSDPIEKIYEEAPANTDQPEDVRVFEFTSMSDVLDFARDGFVAGQVKSVFGTADDRYYLVVTKNRCSWKNFNKLSAKAFDYANVITDVRGKLIYLNEHGEGIIESGALTALKKIAQGK